MHQFIQHYKKQIIGHLSGFDRLVFRGTLKALAVAGGMMSYLWNVGVELKNFGKHAEEITKRLKESSLEQAKKLNRPIEYLASAKPTRKNLPVTLPIETASGKD